MIKNILFNKLPDSVEVEGVLYKVKTDFRDWLKVADLLGDENYLQREKLWILLTVYIETPENKAAAIEAAASFLNMVGWRYERRTGGKGNVFNWTYDAPFVLGAFRQAYGIDLTTEKMHWFVFKSLFDALPDDTMIKKRIAYRSINAGRIKDKERRNEILEIQRMIAIPKGGGF